MTKTITALVSIGVLLLLLNTRIGVFFVFDILGDIGSDNLPTNALEGPVELSRSISADSFIVLPDSIEQASGLHKASNSLFISTDQAELFEIDDHGNLAADVVDLLGGPLLFKQGSLEGIQFEGKSLLGIGELGAVARWEQQENNWERLEDYALDSAIADFEFTGLTLHQEQLWATTDDGLLLLNLSDGSQHRPDLSGFEKANRDQSELLLSGLASDGDILYLLTENYASLIAYQPESGQVLEVIGLDAIEASDIAIENGRAWVSVDHNYFDPRPPIHIYSLED